MLTVRNAVFLNVLMLAMPVALSRPASAQQPTRPEAKMAHMHAAQVFEIPASMRAEHEEIHAALERATQASGRVGEAARALAKVLHPHFVRTHYESVRALSVGSDRVRYEAGFSPLVQFDGRQSLVGDAQHLQTFGAVNWPETLQSWRVLDDPDRAPIRLPGFVCVGGVIQMLSALTPEQYSERFTLFRLDQYAPAFEELIGDRRCQHCDKPLPKTASDRRMYCNSKCSQANRQKRHRVREKEAILRRRGGNAT